MSDYTTNWTANEFKIYLLLYGADIDLEESPEEIEFIKKSLEGEDYDKIHIEFDADNDYQSIQKIQHAFKRLNYSKNDLDGLMLDLKKLFQSDGKFDIVEQNVFRLLKGILE